MTNGDAKVDREGIKTLNDARFPIPHPQWTSNARLTLPEHRADDPTGRCQCHGGDDGRRGLQAIMDVVWTIPEQSSLFEALMSCPRKLFGQRLACACPNCPIAQ